ncbi:MAG: MerR family transcriptional regulator [Dehalococcoidia bacterium]|nr:MerR family transcriptional regulator [Dehalococcoidia bacterium]
MKEVVGLYVTSVAARLLEMHPQTLRKYERVGFIVPVRSGGMHRLYSEADITRLKMIKYLIEDVGLNLAGVEMALTLREAMLKMLEAVSSDESETGRQVQSGIYRMLRILDTDES